MAMQFTKAKILILVSACTLLTIAAVVLFVFTHQARTSVATEVQTTETAAVPVDNIRAQTVRAMQRFQTDLQTGPRVNIRASLITAAQIETSLKAVYVEAGPDAQAELAALEAHFDTLEKQIRAGLDTALVTTSSIIELLKAQREAANENLFISESQSQTIQETAMQIQAGIVIDESTLTTTDRQTQVRPTTTEEEVAIQVDDDSVSSTDDTIDNSSSTETVTAETVTNND